MCPVSLVRRPLRIVLAIAVAALLPAIVSATTVVPGATYGVHLQLPNESLDSVAVGHYALGFLSSTVDGSPAVIGDASLPVGFRTLEFGTLESSITYGYAVVGPADGVLVPMFVTASLGTSASGPVDATSSASARFMLNNGAFDVFNVLREAGSGQCDCVNDFGATLSFEQRSGAVGRVHLQIDLTVYRSGEAHAFADPYIFIDPLFLSSHPGYAMIVSEGIGNAPAAPIPEPDVVSLMLLGLGFVTFKVSRRKTTGA